jgi:hypothetical protein
MDERKSPKHEWSRVLILLILAAVVIRTESFEDEIEQMRKDGINKFDISILYEEKTEFLHSRITLRPLALGLHTFDKMYNEFSRQNLSGLGRVMSNRLEHKLARLKIRADYLLAMEHEVRRDKRAIEFIGNLIAKVFGNPGPEDWKKNNANILAMKYAIARQRDNSILLHNNIDSNQHLIEKHNSLLKKITVDLYNENNRITTAMNELNEIRNYIELETMLDTLIEIEDSIAVIVQDGKVGRCNTKGLSKIFLVNNLRAIESNRVGFAPIFASWEWENYYKFELCSVALNREELWVTMRVPIVRHGELMARVIPAPNFKCLQCEVQSL